MSKLSVTLAKLKPIAVIATLVITFYIGTKMSTTPPPTSDSQGAHNQGDEDEIDTLWTCVMHLQIKQSSPGLCPVCSMELVPIDDSSSNGDLGERQLVMSEWDKKLASLVTAPVERKFVDAEVRMFGKLEYDETNIKSISSWVSGRVDRLYVDYVGIQVEKGDHLVSLYSPDLVTGQEELIEAKRRVDKGGKDKSEFLRNSDLRLLESAREKLRLWGLSDQQVKEIETSTKSEDHILINSPQAGIVIHKAVNDGEYVQTGTHIFTVADLNTLWVKLDAYESDLQWIYYGQSVEIETEAYPGEIFKGLIAFIDPVVDNTTQTVKVRVNVDNKDHRLKPGMFARATVHSKLANSGGIMDSTLAGKWIGPMHPEIISDTAGTCPICNMALVKAESLGHIASDTPQNMPLVVPATAVLRTGRRAVVYVEVPDIEQSTYEGREIVLGARAGDYYLVQSGLSEGEKVVVQGNFNIDSALQIKAKPSMMSMPGDEESSMEESKIGSLRVTIQPLYDSYLNLQPSLMRDDLEASKEAFEEFADVLSRTDANVSKDSSQRAKWDEISKGLSAAITHAAHAEDVEMARMAFQMASEQVLTMRASFGQSGATYYEVFCPMAFGDGASWLQSSKEILNPFMGTSMPTCGSIKNTFPAPLSAASVHQH